MIKREPIIAAKNDEKKYEGKYLIKLFSPSFLIVVLKTIAAIAIEEFKHPPE